MVDQPKDSEALVVMRIPLKKVLSEEFEEAAIKDKGTEYFQKFHFGALIHYGQVLTAYNEMLRVLGECQTINESLYSKIHKGDPYYWLGVAAFLSKDFETAVYFMNAAVSEDIRRDNTKLDTPAHLFMQIRGGQLHQAAKILVENTERRMKELINSYNRYNSEQSSLRQLSLGDLRKHFLLKSLEPKGKAWRSLATALISYVLEYDIRVTQLDLVTDSSSNEAFLLHLFKGCVLLESLLKSNPNSNPGEKTLKSILVALHLDLGIQKIRSISANNLREVIDQYGSAPKTIDGAFECAGKTRNTTGHSLAWEMEITKDEYKRLFEYIGVACLHTIATLYRK